MTKLILTICVALLLSACWNKVPDEILIMNKNNGINEFRTMIDDIGVNDLEIVDGGFDDNTKKYKYTVLPTFTIKNFGRKNLVVKYSEVWGVNENHVDENLRGAIAKLMLLKQLKSSSFTNITAKSINDDVKKFNKYFRDFKEKGGSFNLHILAKEFLKIGDKIKAYPVKNHGYQENWLIDLNADLKRYGYQIK
jgi:hypothetical protein